MFYFDADDYSTPTDLVALIITYNLLIMPQCRQLCYLNGFGSSSYDTIIM